MVLPRPLTGACRRRAGTLALLTACAALLLTTPNLQAQPSQQQPNQFNETKVSSETIAAGVLACKAQVQKDEPSANDVFALIFCSCMMDGYRENLDPESDNVRDHCLTYARQRVADKLQ